MDLAWLFVTGRRLGLPSDERSVPEVLRDGGILSAEDAGVLAALKGFRNILVHRYGTLDGARVREHAKRFPDDARRLTNAFREALAT